MGEARKTRVELLAELRALRDDPESVTSEPEPRDPAWPNPAESDERFRSVLDQMSAALGYHPDEVLGREAIQWVHDDDVDELVEQARALRHTGQPTKASYRAQHKSGHYVWLESSSVTSYRTLEGRYRILSFVRDITEARRTTEALRESEERYHIVTEVSRDIISETDARRRLTYTSPSVEAILGYETAEVVGADPFTFVHPEDVDPTWARFLEGLGSPSPVRISPYRVRHRDGSWLWFESTGIRYRKADGQVRFLAVTRDVTERRRAERERRGLEERMQHAQKLESLGVMAGGIAHDFNNLLTPILGNTSLALMDLPADSPVRARLLKVQKATHRAAALTSQMLAYAGEGPLLVEALNLSQLVREMAQLLESVVSGKAALHFELHPSLPAVEADASQLSQLLMNLVVNACEAIGEGGGSIAIRTGTADIGAETPAHPRLGEEIAPGTCAYLEVEDDGCGMDAETRTRSFDPFFTTKSTGRGLGLPAALGISRGHGGAIEIDSEPGRGARFRLLLPAATRERARSPAEDADQEAWRGSGTALVIDDDEGVRELCEDTLRRAGLSVLRAAEGLEGIELLRDHADEIRIVLLDRTMPSTSGEETFSEIRRIRPQMPIILLSGHSEERAAACFADQDLAGFLHKPFLPTTLLLQVRRALEG
jgi:PAS domain S-box-containing protein